MVVVTTPWIDHRERAWLPGQRVALPADVYAKYAPLEYFARELVRARHFSGREYWHAVGCGDVLERVNPKYPLPVRLDRRSSPEVVPMPGQPPRQPYTYTVRKTEPRCGCHNRTKTNA